MANKTKQTLGAKLRAARDDKGWSRQELATKAGVTDVVIGYWECDRRAPKYEHIKTLAKLFGWDDETLGNAIRAVRVPKDRDKTEAA